MRRLAVTLLVCVTVAAACGESGDPVATTSPGELPTTTELPATTTSRAATTTAPVTTTMAQPVTIYGGSVVIADDQEPPTLNPYASDGDNFIVSIIGQAHLGGAYDIDAATLELIPELVVEPPSVGNGGVVVNDDGTMIVRWQIRDEAV